MTPTKKRIICGILLAILASVTLWYIFWLPPEPRKLHQAIPDSAIVVSTHHNLAQRYPELSTNIFLRHLFTSAGINADDMPPAALAALEKYGPYIAGDTTVLAWTPRLQTTGQPGLIITSYMGHAALLARWIMEWRNDKLFSKMPAFAGHSIWHYNRSFTADEWQAAFTFNDGILIALLSPDPAGLHEIIQTAERLRPATAAPLDYNHQTLPPAAPDRVWLRQPAETAAAVTTVNNQEFTAVIQSAGLLPWSEYAIKPGNLDDMAILLGDRPVMAAMFQPTVAMDIAHQHLPPPYGELISGLFAHNTVPDADNCLGLAILTGADGGGFGRAPWRISIPALIGFSRVGSPEEAHNIMRRTLDRLNAAFKLGLIVDTAPPPSDGGQFRIFKIEATTDNFISRLAPDDLPAYTVTNGWLIFASNAGALARRLNAATEPGAPTARWHTAIETQPASALFWMDMRTGAQTLQLALTGMILQQRGTPAKDRIGDRMRFARNWLEDLKQTGTGLIWLETGIPALHIHIHP